MPNHAMKASSLGSMLRAASQSAVTCVPRRRCARRAANAESLSNETVQRTVHEASGITDLTKFLWVCGHEVVGVNDAPLVAGRQSWPKRRWGPEEKYLHESEERRRAGSFLSEILPAKMAREGHNEHAPCQKPDVGKRTPKRYKQSRQRWRMHTIIPARLPRDYCQA
jgi:hypothetical protein